ncbi:MAG: hypothetical protein AB1497_12105 [Bacillota bacterium]
MSFSLSLKGGRHRQITAMHWLTRLESSCRAPKVSPFMLLSECRYVKAAFLLAVMYFTSNSAGCMLMGYNRPSVCSALLARTLKRYSRGEKAGYLQ